LVGRGTRLHGSGGTAFVAPNAFARAGRAVTVTNGVASVTTGNPGVDPERSFTWDAGVGIERSRAGVRADVTFFATRVRDRITSVRASFPSAARPRTAEGVAIGSVSSNVNAARVEMRGIEWQASWDLGARMGWRRSLRLFAAGTRILAAEETVTSASVDAARFAGRTDFRPEEVLGALVFGRDTTVRIRNVARATVTGGVEWDDPRRVSARLSARYVGERIDQDFRESARVADVLYPAQLVADFVAGVRVAAGTEIRLQVSNLTDEHVYEKRGYDLPGRAVRLGVGVEW
ncbi:TonB-dependent receptor domain-containing protein, partial [Longimicrobium sp.]|uniref:TonB-dependent receptor domain-containing protein n=1 Tax=Longimicrobium sp. TaxID=2029185 RepID=UPI002E35700D